jgi:hypothetical protein
MVTNIVTREFYILDYTSQEYIKYYQYSENKHDALK